MSTFVFRLFELVRAGRVRQATECDGLALPPAVMRFRVAGSTEPAVFLDGGARGARTIRELLAEAGKPLEQCGSVLDFGCGCGRVLRYWWYMPQHFFGLEPDHKMAAWCKQNLPFVTVWRSLDSVRDHHFDAVYAFSVFTHLPLRQQRECLREIRRVLKPDGLLIFSTHGAHYRDRLRQDEKQRFDAGNMVTRFAGAAGSNLCNTFHPESFVRRELAAGWRIVSFKPEGACGNPQQDAWVVRAS